MYLSDTDSEEKLILRRYRNLLKVVRCKDKEDRKQIRKAFQLALDAHTGMRRRSGEPYILHPLEVAIIAAGEIGLGPTSVICALLHDVVEDTDYTLADIELQFGPKVTKIIDGLTKISGIFENPNASQQAENFKKILLTLSDDVRVILIKLADRLHNMRTLGWMPLESQLKISSETSYLFAPLAHRLGLYAIKSELEDLALKYTEPDIYSTLARKLAETETERKRFIHNFIAPIKKDLKAEGIDHEIIGRTKSIYSIYSKMKKKSIPFEEVFDIFAIRVILDSPFEREKVDCWRVYTVVTKHYKPKLDRLRDWLSIPKANGYESLHTTVMSHEGRWVEIQIRTNRMNEIAEKGYAAHWKYKGNGEDQEQGLNEWLNKIRELLQNPDQSALDFLDDFKLNLFSEEIYVFTPKGELRSLPYNASVLDFAYNIHSEIGNRAIGAKVNHRLVPMSHKLKSGDQVEIITSKVQKPREEWFGYVTTARAKTQIKDALKEDRKKQVEKGKALLKEMFDELKIAYDPSTEKAFMDYLKIKSPVNFFYQIAIKEITLQDMKDFLTRSGKRSWLSYIIHPFHRNPRNNKPDGRTLNRIIQDQLKEKPEELLLTGNINEIKYNLGECCNPIPGDDVIGFITSNKGITIHRTSCPEAIKLMSTFGKHIVKTKWANQESIAFLTGIRIHGVDQMGLINDITKVVSEELNINIRSLNINTYDGLSEGTAMLYVSDTQHLNNLIKKLNKLPGVVKVTRI